MGNKLQNVISIDVHFAFNYQCLTKGSVSSSCWSCLLEEDMPEFELCYLMNMKYFSQSPTFTTWSQWSCCLGILWLPREVELWQRKLGLYNFIPASILSLIPECTYNVSNQPRFLLPSCFSSLQPCLSCHGELYAPEIVNKNKLFLP